MYVGLPVFYSDCITANQSGLILDREVLMRTVTAMGRNGSLYDLGYGDAIAFFKHNDLPECASGRRLSGCEDNA
jgi:hypothetical protein